MNTATKISIFGEEVRKYEAILTSKTAAIIFVDEHLERIDYEELDKLDEKALEKLIESSVPGSLLRKEAVERCIKKVLDYKDIKLGSPMANMVFYRIEQLVNDDAETKKMVMQLRWKFFGLIK
ncbi:MAG: hypothetical protein KBF62_01835 [Candidatus Pacebacteria bacterium]|jgi:hypothetical protein|nr:hypothetical protein [Candidatus Paceibacterota bacterium]MBP9058360.1 hypothetical protein [Candidatus Paceibacterota bacterium]MBP9770082.1 hypothetical protein [Candidatus Paceibacterota bacterium]